MPVSTVGVIARMAIAALAASFIAVAAAAAADVPGIMAQWGMLGTWASSCTAPASRDNPYYSWVRRGADASLDRDYGDAKDSNRVLGASVLPDGSLELRVEFKAFSQTRLNVYTKGNDGRIRMMTNQDVRGGYSVRDGKLVANGAATPWDTRCR